MDEELLHAIRLRKAATSFAWWGRISFAVWTLEVAVTFEAWYLAVPVWFLEFSAEMLAPGIRKRGETGAATVVHFLGVPFFALLFWSLADASLPFASGRLLAFTFASTVLGGVSAWRLWEARRHAPYRIPGRTPEVIDAHRRIARGAAIMGGLWSVLTGLVGLLAAVAAGPNPALKLLAIAGLTLWATLLIHRSVAGGIGVRGASTLVTLAACATLAVALVVSIGMAGLGLFLIGLPLGWVSIASLRLVAGGLDGARPRSATIWREDLHRPSRDI
jgi:hypothetical protein